MARRTPGNYVPLDVNYVRDSAIRRAGEAAELLFVRSLAYCKGARKGGEIPDYDLEVVAVGMKNVSRRVDSLVAQRLWEPIEGGWRIRSWARWNNESDGLERASSKGNHQRWHVNEHKTDPLCEWCGESPKESDGESPGESRGEIPREGKGREGKGSSSSRASAAGKKRATPLPDAWAPTDTHRAYCDEHGLDLAAEVFKFRNHAHGNDRRQVVWNAAFSTWLGNARDYRRPARAQQGEIDVNPWITR